MIVVYSHSKKYATTARAHDLNGGGRGVTFHGRILHKKMRKMFCLIFENKSGTSSVRQVRPRRFVILPNFVKAYQSSKAPSSCLGGEQFFVGREIKKIFELKCRNYKEYVNHENLIRFLSESLAGRRPPKRVKFYAAIKQWRCNICLYVSPMHPSPYACSKNSVHESRSPFYKFTTHRRLIKPLHVSNFD